MKERKQDKKAAESIESIERKPLFTGDYRRDTSVSEAEKLSEVAEHIYSLFHRKKGK